MIFVHINCSPKQTALSLAFTWGVSISALTSAGEEPLQVFSYTGELERGLALHLVSCAWEKALLCFICYFMLRILHSTNISFAVLFFIWLGLSIALLPLLESAQKNKMYNHFASNSIHSKKPLPENLKQFGHPGSVAAGHHPGRFGTSPRAARRQLLRPDVNKPWNHQISLWHTLELQIEWRKIGTQPFRKEVGAFKATKACKKRSATTSWSNAVMMEKRSRNVASIQSQRVLPQNVSSDLY